MADPAIILNERLRSPLYGEAVEAAKDGIESGVSWEELKHDLIEAYPPLFAGLDKPNETALVSLMLVTAADELEDVDLDEEFGDDEDDA